jgi:apolipoprotein D and lipocalin family protein
MKTAIKRSLLAILSLALTACAMRDASTAPQPAKPIDTARFYSGRWYEIARTPMMFTNGCVAGTTDFFHRPDGQLIERDACRRGTPTGSEKIFQGPADILNPGENTKITVHYTLYGFIPVSQTYWMLDHADDYSWFIVSTPTLSNIALLGRTPRPSAAEIAALTARAQNLGYDTSKLEYPEEFPPG